MNRLIAVLTAIALLPAATHAQAPPDNPAPTPLPDPTWNWVERLVTGQPIIVKPTAGPPVHCRFAGATDAYLFCDLDEARAGTGGYRFDRAQVVNVKISHPKVNWHPALLTVMAASGVAIGLAASQQGASDKSAAAGGLVTALMVGAVGYSIAIMQEQDRGFTFNYPLAALRFSGLRTHAIVHWSPR